MKYSTLRNFLLLLICGFAICNFIEISIASEYNENTYTTGMTDGSSYGTGYGDMNSVMQNNGMMNNNFNGNMMNGNMSNGMMMGDNGFNNGNIRHRVRSIVDNILNLNQGKNMSGDVNTSVHTSGATDCNDELTFSLFDVLGNEKFQK